MNLTHCKNEEIFSCVHVRNMCILSTSWFWDVFLNFTNRQLWPYKNFWHTCVGPQTCGDPIQPNMLEHSLTMHWQKLPVSLQSPRKRSRACTEWWSKRPQYLSNSPNMASLRVWTQCMNARRSRCQKYLNSFYAAEKLEENIGTSSYR